MNKPTILMIIIAILLITLTIMAGILTIEYENKENTCKTTTNQIKGIHDEEKQECRILNTYTDYELIKRIN